MKTLLWLVILSCVSAGPLWAQGELQNTEKELTDSLQTGARNVDGLKIPNLNLLNKIVSSCQAAHPEPIALTEVFPDLYCCKESAVPQQQKACLDANITKLGDLSRYVANLESFTDHFAVSLYCNVPASSLNLPPPGTDADAFAVSNDYLAMDKCLDLLKGFEDKIKEKFSIIK